jgi:CRISPR-associated endonuclease Cas1
MTDSVDSPVLTAGSRRKLGVLTLAGYGLRMAVERGHLVLEDGTARNRRRIRLSRAERFIKRIVIIGHAGMVTLDALQWLHDVGVGLMHLGHDGELLVATGPQGADLPRLRRAQATAAASGAALAIAKDLVSEKLIGQETVLHQIPGTERTRERIRATRGVIPEARDDEQLRMMEMTAARSYWDAWGSVEIRFTTPGRSRIPDHWTRFGSRLSLISGTGRKASNPANAILNYLYAILEAEARLAGMGVGLDPGLGFFHSDTKSRHSLACDLMEPIRPTVDVFLLQLLQERRFDREAFFELPDGGCRLMPVMTRELAGTSQEWAKKVAPIAEGVAAQLLASGGPVGPGETTDKRWRSRDRSERSPTPLTGWNRKVGHAGRNGGPSHRERSGNPSWKRGAHLTPPGLAVLANSIGQKEERLPPKDSRLLSHWDEPLPPVPELDPQDPKSRGRFLRELLPHLKRLSAAELAVATGLSVSYCARIRRGGSIPDRRHWGRLREVAQA